MTEAGDVYILIPANFNISVPLPLQKRYFRRHMCRPTWESQKMRKLRTAKLEDFPKPKHILVLIRNLQIKWPSRELTKHIWMEY
jgi:hypothetical protein